MELVKKIDMHGHTVRRHGIHRPGVGGHFATVPELFYIYEKLGIEKAALLPNISPDRAFQSNTNEEIYEIVQANPDRFYFYCNVDPRMCGNSADADFTYILEYYKGLGAKGVGV